MGTIGAGHAKREYQLSARKILQLCVSGTYLDLKLSEQD